MEAAAQRRNVSAAAEHLASLAREHTLVLTHGNGPQVGLLSLQAEAHDPDNPTPLDVLGAETEGMIGYVIAQELQGRLPGRQVAALLTQVEVDPADPGFRDPTKPIGPVYDEATAREMARTRRWAIGPDGDGWRRLVASPRPLRILELETIRLLVEHQIVVVCAGGGGIPVVVLSDGGIRGVEAVVDKDATTGLLARELGADGLLLVTDVPGVVRGWGTPQAEVIEELTVTEAHELGLPEGSMGPKVRACADFVRATGGWAAIGALDSASDVVAGRAGTRIVEG